MAADTHVRGRIVLAAGKDINSYRIITEIDSEIADNASGAEPAYLIPQGADKDRLMPRNDGQPWPIPSGPHVLPGELLLLGIIPSSANAAADVDTTGAANDAYHIAYRDYDVQGQRITRTSAYVDETERTTTTGVAPPVDPKLNPGQLTFTHAWGPMPPGSAKTIYGRLQVDLRSAT